METYFASPEKAENKEITTEIDIASNNPVMSGLLHSISGILVILNEHRQIIAVNHSFLKLLGIDDAANVLGLRPGEALHCIHAEDSPAGCGTTKFCSTCGAAIAIVSSLGQDIPVERICALEATKDNKPVDLALLVKSHPIKIDGKRFVLLFLQDITHQQHRAALERTFFHDVNNMLTMLVQASDMLLEKTPSELAEIISQASLRLHKEVAIQRCLSEANSYDYQPTWHDTTIDKIVHQLQSFFVNHPAANNKQIDFPSRLPDVTIKTDISLLLRVLCNIIINALEASTENCKVKFWVELEGKFLTFCVWNHQEIPKETAQRIFQRNFSTKEQAGRGIGTFSMKLFGEKILGGQIKFTSSKTEGTTFRFTHSL